MGDNNQITKAIDALKSGKLIGLPTETVYGLAAPIDNEKLLKKVFSLKERPFFDPLIVHVADEEQAKKLVTSWPKVAEKLCEEFWPGPLTLVLEKNSSVSDLITAGLPTVGLRSPKHPVARELLTELGTPLAAPSANKFKQISPVLSEHVSQVFDPEDVFVLEGGQCDVGIESTIVKVDPNSLKILRRGMISKEEIENAVHSFGVSVEYLEESKVEAPGQMQDHYQPEKPLYVVDANSLDEANEKLTHSKHSSTTINWTELTDEPAIAARELYQVLRKACDTECESCGLLIQPKWLSDDRWSAILDRVKKASTYDLISID